MRLYLTALVVVFVCFNISTVAGEKIKSEDIPSPMREMRAVWVATVANIDWPSAPGLPVEVQKQEIIKILDRVKELNMNAVILQVRPQGDAFYNSDLEPWSYFLTGEEGKAPEPFYDPLEYWITEAHQRGLELHAWFNPYRANHPEMKSEISNKSIIKTHPECVKKLGQEGYYWMNPAMQKVQDHSFAVVMDVVRRYDIDAVHFDDYFYPYTEYNNGKDFPDDDTYLEYKNSGGTLARDDWRRDAVNKFIKRVYDGVKKEKPNVKVGISPFGVYRPGYPKEIRATFDQYSTLYADAKLWLNKGWADYFVPQLYWNISNQSLSYPILLNWWTSENTHKINLWPGLFIRPEVDKSKMALEIINQIMVTRGMVYDKPGTMIFSIRSLFPDDSISTGSMLSNGPFNTQALIPAYPWIDNVPPDSPQLKAIQEDGKVKISWQNNSDEKPFLNVVYFNVNGKWLYEIVSAGKSEIIKEAGNNKISAVAVSAVDRNGNESVKSIFQFD